MKIINRKISKSFFHDLSRYIMERVVEEAIKGDIDNIPYIEERKKREKREKEKNINIHKKKHMKNKILMGNIDKKIVMRILGIKKLKISLRSLVYRERPMILM